MAGEARLQAARGYRWGLHTYAHLTGVSKRDVPLGALAKSFQARCIGPDTSYMGGLSLLWGFGDPHEAKIIRCMRERLPFFHIDHAYFKRGYENGNFRINFAHFHQTGMLDVPADRAPLARKRLEEWKKGREVVVIVPSERICTVLSTLRGRFVGPKDWCRETEAELKKHTDRPIIRKEKGGSLLDNLRTAHAVVSLSSVAEVEAAVRGVPVFTSWDSPACQVSEKDLSKIETPAYPDREAWLRTLSYSQFTLQEMSNGTAASILKDIYELFDPTDLRGAANSGL